MSKKTLLTKLAWIFLAAIFLFWLAVVWKYSRNLPELPPGDFQRDAAITHNLLAGNFLGDAAYKGEYAFYPFLSHLFYAGFYWLTKIPVELLYLSYPLVLTIPALGLIIFSAWRIIKNALFVLAVVFALIFLFPLTTAHFNVISHPFDLAFGFLALGIYLFWRAVSSEKLHDFILAGVGITLAIYSHPFAAFTLCGGVALYQLISRKNWKYFFIMVVVAFILVSPFIWPWISHYKLRPINTRTIAFMPNEQTIDVFFFGYGNLRWLNCLFILSGILVALFRRSKLDKLLLSLFCFSLFFVIWGVLSAQFGSLLGRFQPPTSFVWQDINDTLHFVSAFLFGLGLWYWVESLPKKISVVLFLLMVLLYGSLMIPRFVDRAKGWYPSQAIYFPYTAPWQATTSWIKKNTSINDVFLAHSGPSYLFVGGMTGRKVVVTDQWHSNPFVNQAQRMADHELMFQTPDLSVFLSLAKKYQVDYLIISPYEQSFAGEGIKKFSDPKIFQPVFTSAPITIYRLLMPRSIND